MEALWITYLHFQKGVDKRWIKYLIWGISFCSFRMWIRNVDKLSTGTVDNFESYPPVHKSVDKLSTIAVDNFKGYLPVRDSVENLSTGSVDKFENTKQAEDTRGLLHKST